MGHKLSRFIAVDELLRHRGIHAPEIIAEDAHEGFVLLEDMGDTTSAAHRGLVYAGNAPCKERR